MNLLLVEGNGGVSAKYFQSGVRPEAERWLVGIGARSFGASVEVSMVACGADNRLLGRVTDTDSSSIKVGLLMGISAPICSCPARLPCRWYLFENSLLFVDKS